MSKKKASPKSTKTERVKAPTAANPVQPQDVVRPPKAPASAPTVTAAPRLPFKRPQSWNFAGVGRNDICPCGSGKRFKNCHGH